MSLSRCVLCFFVLGIPGFPPPLPAGLDVWDHILALGRCELLVETQQSCQSDCLLSFLRQLWLRAFNDMPWSVDDGLVQ